MIQAEKMINEARLATISKEKIANLMKQYAMQSIDEFLMFLIDKNHMNMNQRERLKNVVIEFKSMLK